MVVPWWQVPAWVPVFLAGVIENWCDAGRRESWLGEGLPIASEPKHWCVEENVSFDQKLGVSFFSGLIFTF